MQFPTRCCSLHDVTRGINSHLVLRQECLCSLQVASEVRWRPGEVAKSPTKHIDRRVGTGQRFSIALDNTARCTILHTKPVVAWSSGAEHFHRDKCPARELSSVSVESWDCELDA